ncbi:MAG: metal-dependent transcriptional regulator [Solirubrobacterales bacterium]
MTSQTTQIKTPDAPSAAASERRQPTRTAAGADSSRVDALPSSAAIQDYAKAIYSISDRTGEPVATSALAERLDVSPASATAMVKRMAEMSLLTHEPYRGVELTDEGQRIALEMVRHHRLIELFLHETFNMPWDEVHDEAEVLEHAISERLEELIAEKLGNPRFDPHGDPIPTRDGEIADIDHVALSSLEVGEQGEFVRVSDSDPEMLRYLAGLGVAPGHTFAVADRQPFDGPLFIDFAGVAERQVIGHGLATAMRVVREVAA